MAEVKKYPASKPEDLLKRISAAYPELKWSAYKLITDGWDHEVIILDDKLVFRFPNDEDYASSLRTEIEVLRQLEPLLELNIPKYTYVAPDHSFAGYPIIPGKFLGKKLFDDLKPEQRATITKQLAAMLSTMHNLIGKGHDFSAVPGSYMPDDQAQVKRQAKQYLSGVLTKPEMATVHEILADVDKLLLKPLPAVLLHGDVYSQHLLWDETANRLGVIDFSDMALGDPAIDFAELHEYGQEFVQEVYDIYTGPKDNTFLARAWAYQRWVGVYMMTDHFVYHKTSFETARQTFDRIEQAN